MNIFANLSQFCYICLMSQMLDQFRARLRTQGYSLTHAREAVFMALQNQEPLTINQLVEACPKIDRASIYRTVKVFEKLGIVQRLQIGWKYKLELSDEFHVHHHHFTCLNCNTTTALPESTELEAHLVGLSAKNNFKMQNHLLEISGLCQNCQQIQSVL